MYGSLSYWIGMMRGLAADRSGNVLLLGAASLIPLIAMLGGAMDTARAYLVRTRLQQACDAAVLAGRAAMGNKSWNNEAKASADRYFVSNLGPGQYGSASARIDYEQRGESTVHGMAVVSVPMTVMKFFGFGMFNFKTTCDAKLDLPNADVMFVLDTTLSMSERNPGDSVSRIEALRASVLSFYTALEGSKGTTSRVRYGFVPYASTVNVGTLLKPAWLVDSWNYQSRVAREVEQVTYQEEPFKNVSDGPWTYVSGSRQTTSYTVPTERCTAKSDTQYIPYEEDRVDNPDGTASWFQVQKINSIQRSYKISNGVCTITETKFVDYVQKQQWRKIHNPKAGPSSYNRYWWDYGSLPYPVTALKATDAQGNIVGGEFIANIANDHQPRTIKWARNNACIEERQSAPDNDAINAGAGYDLDVDGVPVAGDPRTQWRPALPGLIYSRKQSNANDIRDKLWGNPVGVLHTADNFITPSSDTTLRAACPASARKLTEIDTSTLKSYLASLTPAGLTYHDVGFLWGLRLLSAQGLFSSENQAPATGKLARHLIFMTDGQTETNIADYDAYGLSALDRRRTPASRLPTATEQNTLVERRLAGLCTVAKAKGVTVWVIAFGTSLTPLLSQCADEGHAMEAKDAAELQNAFADIAKRIAQLRLVR